MHRLWVAVSLLFAVYAQHDQGSNECRNIEDAVKPDRSDCTRYIYCWQSRVYLFKCHTGFTYDRCQQRCVKIIEPCEHKSVCQCALNPECVVQVSEVRLNDPQLPPDLASDTTVAPGQLDSSVESSSPFASTPLPDGAVQVAGEPTTTAAGYLVKVLFNRDKSELAGGYGAGAANEDDMQSVTAFAGVTIMEEEASSLSGTDEVTDAVTLVDTSAAGEGETTEATGAETGNESEAGTSVTGVSGLQTEATPGAASESTDEPISQSSPVDAVEETTGETVAVSDGAATDIPSLETSSLAAEDVSEVTIAVSGATIGEGVEVESTTSSSAGEEASSGLPETVSESSTDIPLEGESSVEATATILSDDTSSVTDAVSAVYGLEEGTGATDLASENLVEGTSVATPEETSDSPAGTGADESGDQTTVSPSESSAIASEDTTGLTIAPGETTGAAVTGATLESGSATVEVELFDTTLAITVEETNVSEDPGAGRQYIDGVSVSPDAEAPTTASSTAEDESAPPSEAVTEDAQQSTDEGGEASNSEAAFTGETTNFPIETASTDVASEATVIDETTSSPLETAPADGVTEVDESFVTEVAPTAGVDQGVEGFEPVTEEATTELSNDSGPRVTPEEERENGDTTDSASRMFEEGAPSTELLASSSSAPEITSGPLNLEEQSTIIEAAQSQPTELPELTGCACDSRGVAGVQNVRAHCAQLICRNGGKYFTISSGHCGCVCAPPYRGVECEHLTDVSQCRCANGGKCMPMRVAGSSFEAYSCECPLGFLGSLCQYSVAEIIVNDSSTNSAFATTIDLARYALCDRQDSCSNSGLCLLDVITKKQRCYCPPGFGGPTCGTVLS